MDDYSRIKLMQFIEGELHRVTKMEKTELPEFGQGYYSGKEMLLFQLMARFFPLEDQEQIMDSLDRP